MLAKTRRYPVGYPQRDGDFASRNISVCVIPALPAGMGAQQSGKQPAAPYELAELMGDTTDVKLS
jgi:hypothetical protein